jgi:uncharacterized protein
MLTEKDNEFLQQVKATVLSVDPTAEVWLFGSRARGDAREDSDWDFFVLTNQNATWQYKHSLRDKLYDIGYEAGNGVSAIIQSKQNYPLVAVTDLYRNVITEGKYL